jgi:hypothetical protein
LGRGWGWVRLRGKRRRSGSSKYMVEACWPVKLQKASVASLLNT